MASFFGVKIDLLRFLFCQSQEHAFDLYRTKNAKKCKKKKESVLR